MKKLIVVGLVFVLGLSLVLGVSAKAESEAETAYNVMVNAKNEGRQLTADEIVEVEKVAKSLIMFNDNLTEVEKDQHRAISAMYINYKIDEVFDEAKNNFDKIGAN